MKEETLKDYCKKWSIDMIVGNLTSAGMMYMAQGDLSELKETRRILKNEIKRRIREARKRV